MRAHNRAEEGIKRVQRTRDDVRDCCGCGGDENSADGNDDNEVEVDADDEVEVDDADVDDADEGVTGVATERPSWAHTFS